MSERRHPTSVRTEATGTVTPAHVARPLTLEPFRAVRLAASRIGDPASGRTFARPYRDVAARMKGWEQRGLLVHDAHPALYLHEYAGAGTTIRGLVGALDVSRRAIDPKDRAILPHEGIYPAQADDLADRMGEMALNPAPILLVQRSPSSLRAILGGVRDRVPEHQFVDRHGHAHRLWTIREGATQAAIAEALAPTTALIADGHHRYAAYLRVQQRDPRPATRSGLAMLVDQDDTPLLLGAIHRVLAGATCAHVMAAAQLIGLGTETVSRSVALAAVGPSTMVVTDTHSWSVLHLPARDPHSAVELLHEHLVPALAYGPSRITYHHTIDDALAHAGPHHGSAVLLPATSLDRVLHIARQDRLLPEKATSFQPKPPIGVLIRSLRDE